MATKVVMPQLGESVIEGTVVKWLCSEGDQVEEMENILEIETDKVTTEIPSPATGVILKQLVAEGVTVRAGVTLAWIGKAGENPPQDEQNEANQMSAAPAQPPDLTKITS